MLYLDIRTTVLVKLTINIVCLELKLNLCTNSGVFFQVDPTGLLSTQNDLTHVAGNYVSKLFLSAERTKSRRRPCRPGPGLITNQIILFIFCAGDV